MSEEKKPSTVSNIDNKRIEKLAQHGHYNSMLEQFELLRLKFIYGEEMNKEEGIKFITMAKYFAQYGHSEPFRYSCQLILKKYVTPHGL